MYVTNNILFYLVKLKRECVGQVFASSFNTKTQGVAVFINKNVPFCVPKTIIDPLGCYIVVHGRMYSDLAKFIST